MQKIEKVTTVIAQKEQMPLTELHYVKIIQKHPMEEKKQQKQPKKQQKKQLKKQKQPKLLKVTPIVDQVQQQLLMKMEKLRVHLVPHPAATVPPTGIEEDLSKWD